MRNLSKSKLLAFRQCPKRLWLEIHHPELRKDSSATLASFATGHQVGDIARHIYDPQGTGQLIDAQKEGFAAAFARSQTLLASNQPIFEAGFSAGGALAFADVMLPVPSEGPLSWKMVEVKSSTSVKDYHRDDVAIQAHVAKTSGVTLASVALAHIDSNWVYPGDQNYAGLLTEADLSDEAFARSDEVQGWITGAQLTASEATEPSLTTGPHCRAPFECGFIDHCRGQEPQAEFPVRWLPRIQSASLKLHIEELESGDMRDVPDHLLNEQQRRVRAATVSGDIYFDAAGAVADLAAHTLPAYFLDFETIQFVVPIWAGTKPFQQIPFQFSAHSLHPDGELTQESFLALSGADPSLAFAKALIAACGKAWPVFVYNAGFETARIKELALRFPELSSALLAINARVVDLLPIARTRYYHPSQQGSWSIKKVLPAVAPDLRYDALDGVQDGGMAQLAFLEAIAPQTPATRKAEIEHQLLQYCGLDTFAMVRLWQFFVGDQTQLKRTTHDVKTA